MKLSVVNSALAGMTLDEALAYLRGLGVKEYDLGVGGYPGRAHADAVKLIGDKAARDELIATFEKYGMKISALAVHGNMVHPSKDIAAKFDEDFKAACVLAGQLGIDRVITFSGCPGSDPDAKQPSWVTCSWPPEYLKVLDYQWNEVLIPYWKEAVKFAEANGVKRIALEMHPGFCVYNPETLLRLREAVGPIIGANLDPSHLIWQGMDIIDVINELGDAIYYFHAKDTKIDPINCPVNGVLDTKNFTDEINRAWIFRSVGYGHDSSVWKDIVSNLRLVGYDDVLSIEHEDSLMTPTEGLQKAISFLKEVLVFEAKNTDVFWA